MISIDRRALMSGALTVSGLAASPFTAFAQAGAAATGPDAALDAIAAIAGGPPAIAAGIVTRAGLEWSGVRGVRQAGGTDAATLDDRWHMGSNTKAMTAAVFARLVDQDRARWAMPLAEAFPGAMIDPAFADVTVDDLMRHKAGLTDAAMPTPNVARADPRSPVEQRAAVVDSALSRPPTGTKGAFAYANINYVLVGAAIERISGKSWEAMMGSELFQPLGLTSAGFGAPESNINGGANPWGHRAGSEATKIPVDPTSPGADNPPLLGPAGRAHMTLADYATFVQAMIGGAPEGWLRPERIGVLTTPLPGDGYSMGWIARPESWAGDTMTIAHEGSNTLWHAIVVAAPAKGLGFIVLSNGGFEGRSAAVPLIQRLIRERVAAT
ncbi:MAG TPA: serine hydrolase domain-containing protein [Brevundimonas sp.]|jgi:CubicO group peptidase (beta-lactamase class C family)